MESTAIEGMSNGALALLGITAFLLWVTLTSQEDRESVGSAVGKLVGLLMKVAFFSVGTGIIVSVLLGIAAGMES